MKSSTTSKFVLIGFFIYCVCVSVFLLFGSILSGNSKEKILTESEKSLLYMKGKQEETLSDLREDLFFISNLDNVEHYQLDKLKAGRDLYEVLKTKKFFDHIRIFDTAGHEVIRVNSGNDPIIVDSAELQSKAKRPYFMEARKLKKGEYYTSPMSLNTENGVVETPRKPIVRILTPIFNEQKKVGYLAINFKMFRLLHNFDFIGPDGNRFDIIDESNTSLNSLLANTQSSKSYFPNGKPKAVTNQKGKKITRFSNDQFHFAAVQMDWKQNESQTLTGSIPNGNSNQEFTLIHAIPLSELQVWKNDFFWVLVASFILFTLLYSFFFRFLYKQRKHHLESELKLHSIFNKSAAFIGLLSLDGTLLEANDTALIFGGFSREQALGNKFWDAPWWSLSEEIQENLKSAINRASKGESVRYDVDVVGGEGQIITIDFSLQPVKDEYDNIIYVIPEGRDISEKIELQREIESNNQQYRAVQKLSNTGVWSVDLKANRIIWDKTVYAIHELEETGELSVEDGISFYREDFQPVLQTAIDNAIENNEPWDLEAVLVTAKGKEVWVRALGYPVFENGELTELRGTFINIDSRKRNEQELAEKEKRLKLALDAAKLGMWDWDITTGHLEWDDALYKMYGIEKENFNSTYEAWENTLHPEDAQRANKAVKESIETGKALNINFRIINEKGNVRHIRANAALLFDQNGKPNRMIGVNKDITKRVKNEKEIKDLNANLEDKVLQRTAELNALKVELEQQLRLLGVSAMVSETDLNGRIINANKTFCEMSGYSLDELLGERHSKLKSNVQSLELYEKLWLTISNGGTWQGELCNKNKSGKLYWVHATIQPFLDENNSIVRYVGVYFDITKLKNSSYQLKKMNDQLDAVNKELETFSYSVSHDLKAPLRALQGFSDNIVDRYSDSLDETGVRWLHFIRDNASRMDDLISDILSYSRINKSTTQLNKFSMRQVIEDKLNTIQPGYDIEAKIVIEDDLPNITSDKTMMEIIWQNLIDNAFKYSMKKGEAQIKIWAESDTKGVTYFIQDNGSGFDMRYYDKLFGVFQRLHSTEEFEGTGVGLANVQRIIQKHNGRIKASGEVDKGATFQFFLPFPKITL